MAEPKTVPMTAITDGTYGGEAFHTGDVIEVEEQYVETLFLARLAIRTNQDEPPTPDEPNTPKVTVVKPRTPPGKR